MYKNAHVAFNCIWIEKAGLDDVVAAMTCLFSFTKQFGGSAIKCETDDNKPGERVLYFKGMSRCVDQPWLVYKLLFDTDQDMQAAIAMLDKLDLSKVEENTPLFSETLGYDQVDTVERYNDYKQKMFDVIGKYVMSNVSIFFTANEEGKTEDINIIAYAPDGTQLILDKRPSNDEVMEYAYRNISPNGVDGEFEVSVNRIKTLATAKKFDLNDCLNNQ
ncbi:hypothetical protein [Photobacterium leiognathi]|uniref:hypothetical protein n=1 Tax=Photobacterium leiognathi TaxID=553611 RepID=UPI0029822354|nr:hypothetical protein [Photobacterium leiognathi]